MFSRRWLINYFLIVLIILFTYIGNRFDVKTGSRNSNATPVSEISVERVESIEIRTADGSLMLRRSEGGWRIESPIRWPANNVNVARALDIVNSKTESRLDANEIDLDRFGLQFPQAVMRLDQTQILFGSTNNIGERRYTMIGDEVFLLPDLHLPFISQGLIGLVDRRLLPPTLPLAALTLSGLRFERTADGGWRDIDGKFPPPQVDALVANWQGLQANRVAPYRSTSTPRQKLLARFDDGTSLEFYLLSIDPEIVIANPRIGLQYHFRGDLYYQLLSLRDEADQA